MKSFTIKRGTKKQFRAKLRDSSGAPIDLTGATTKLVVCSGMESTTPVIDVTLSLDGAASGGEVKYDFVPAETVGLSGGSYVAEVETEYSATDIIVYDTFNFIVSSRARA